MIHGVEWNPCRLECHQHPHMVEKCIIGAKDLTIKDQVKNFDFFYSSISSAKNNFSSALNSKLPVGSIDKKWINYKNSINLVSPANKRNIDVIVVGTGLAGGSAAATLAAAAEGGVGQVGCA